MYDKNYEKYMDIKQFKKYTANVRKFPKIKLVITLLDLLQNPIYFYKLSKINYY